MWKPLGAFGTAVVTPYNHVVDRMIKSSHSLLFLKVDSGSKHHSLPPKSKVVRRGKLTDDSSCPFLIKELEQDVIDCLEDLDRALAFRYGDNNKRVINLFAAGQDTTQLVKYVVKEQIDIDLSYCCNGWLMLINFIGYVSLGALLYSSHHGLEEWGYLNSVYFMFTSMSTTGFGDFTPVGKGIDQSFMFSTTVFILLGIGLLGRVITNLRRKMTRMFANNHSRGKPRGKKRTTGQLSPKAAVYNVPKAPSLLRYFRHKERLSSKMYNIVECPQLEDTNSCSLYGNRLFPANLDINFSHTNLPSVTKTTIDI